MPQQRCSVAASQCYSVARSRSVLLAMGFIFKALCGYSVFFGWYFCNFIASAIRYDNSQDCSILRGIDVPYRTIDCVVSARQREEKVGAMKRAGVLLQTTGRNDKAL